MAQDTDAGRYRLRAQRLRVIAAEDPNRETREVLERIAKDFDRMARDAEGRDQLAPFLGQTTGPTGWPQNSPFRARFLFPR